MSYIPDRKARPYELECGHKVWFKFPPDIEDHIWCKSCEEYKRLQSADVTQHGRYYQEDFWSERVGRSNVKFKGGCLVCDFEHTTSKGWFQLRDVMHAHYMRNHSRFGAKLVIEVVKTPTEPPF